MFSKSTLFQKLNGVRLGCAFSKENVRTVSGNARASQPKSYLLAFVQLFTNLEQLMFWILVWHFAGTQTDSFKTRVWNFTLLIPASYSFRILCSLFCSLFFALISLFALFLLSFCSLLGLSFALSFWLSSLWPFLVSLTMSCPFAVFSLFLFDRLAEKFFVCSCAFGWAQ